MEHDLEEADSNLDWFPELDAGNTSLTPVKKSVSYLRHRFNGEFDFLRQILPFYRKLQVLIPDIMHNEVANFR